MIFSDLVNQPTVFAAEKMMAFTQLRQRVLAENIANMDNPHYRTKQLDTEAFQQSLRRAMDAADARSGGGFQIEGTNEFTEDGSGRLVVTPSEEPAENVLFHDDTNARVERQMAMMAENTMMHQLASELLRERFDGLLKAIRGNI